MGSNIKAQSIEVNADAINRGLQDGLPFVGRDLSAIDRERDGFHILSSI